MEEEKLNEADSEETESVDTVGEEVEESVEVLKQALEAEQTKAEEYLAKWQRAQADFINYRRRSEKEKEELGENTRSYMALKLIPVLDDFERAVSAEPEGSVDSGWVEGIKLIEKKLRTILETEGLSPIQAEGEPFDPYLHEAIRQAPGEEGIILYEVQKGYKFNDKVIRASQVIVGSRETEEIE